METIFEFAANIAFSILGTAGGILQSFSFFPIFTIVALVGISTLTTICDSRSKKLKA